MGYRRFVNLSTCLACQQLWYNMITALNKPTSDCTEAYCHVRFQLVLPEEIISIALYRHVVQTEEAVEDDPVSLLQLLLVCWLHQNAQP